MSQNGDPEIGLSDPGHCLALGQLEVARNAGPWLTKRASLPISARPKQHAVQDERG